MLNHRTPSRRRGLTLLGVTALATVAWLLALSSPASARVVILPRIAQGGAVETFSVRVANERSDVESTWVELRFPTDRPIPSAAVTPAEGWTATIETRPLDEPITIGDQQFDEAVASIRWEGGRVAPGTFDQFLVTAGPLPMEGQLVFAATQGYSDGSSDEFTDPAPADDAPKAPTIDLVASPAVPGAAPAAANTPVTAAPQGAPGEPVEAASPARPEHATHGSSGFNPVWMLLVATLLIAVALTVLQRRSGTVEEETDDEETDVEEEDLTDEDVTDEDVTDEEEEDVADEGEKEVVEEEVG